MRCVFWTITERLAEKPEICNADGDSFEPFQVKWKLNCPRSEALEALRPLHKGDFTNGRGVEPLKFHWLVTAEGDQSPDQKSTVLAHFKVGEQSLTAHVNSRRRAEIARVRVQDLLGDRVTFEEICEETPPQEAREQHTITEQESASSPELQAHLKSTVLEKLVRLPNSNA
ncbi:MAG: hypothetical protein GX589_09295 [Deltaproteobacteria bacterium]|nr:hypothetical protein [Deltaproteobacteria bacterium]